MANFTPQQIEQFLQEFFDVVGARQYVGARYVPIFGRAGEDTVEWDNLAPYEPLTVVMHVGISYVSRRYVPTGIQITDTDYWVQTYRFNAQVEQYRQEVLALDRRVTDNAQAISDETSARDAADSQIREDFADADSQIREDVADDYVPFPDGITWPKLGTLGQVLSTLANGDTKWTDPVVPSDAQAEAVITQWLNAHPEATTTVQNGSITWAKLATSIMPYIVHASDMHVGPGDYATKLPDANNQPLNAIYLINHGITDQMIQNLPIYNHAGILIRFAFRNSAEQGTAQLYMARESSNPSYTKIYVRMSYGGGNAPTYNPWTEIDTLDKKIEYTRLSDSLISHFLGTGFHVQTSNYQTTLPDADLQPNNTIYLINAYITSVMTQNLPVYNVGGVLIKFSFSSTNLQGVAQAYITVNGDAYVRVAYGAGDVPTFGAWNRLYGRSEKLTHDTTMIFKKVVACGDSYTSGWINNVHTNEDYAWPAYMSKITGQNWINCGSSGATVLSWQTAARGLAAAQAAGPAQAYVIGLMINDVGNVSLGTASDIGTQAQTYYGGLSQIVEALHAISASAKIFIQTCPRTTDTFQPYNQAVRDVVTHYANSMHTHLLDLYAHIDLYDVPSITGDAKLEHYTAIGYEQFAQNLNYIMSDYINTHITAFQDVYAIPTA